MHRRSFKFLIGIQVGSSLVVLALASVCFAQGMSKNVERNGSTSTATLLGLEMNLSKENFIDSDDVSVRVRLKNLSKRVVYLPAAFDWGSSGLLLSIKDSSGIELPQTFIADAPPHRACENSIVTLLPGAENEIRFREHLSNLNIKHAGNYTFQASYRSPADSHTLCGHPVISSEDGEVKSSSITIRVHSAASLPN